jgi:predicted nucleotidyltransferase
MNKEQQIERIKEMLKSLEELVRKEYKAEIIGLFGSYVRGEQKEKSDIDILVKFQEGATLLDFGGLAVFLKEILGLKVDVVPVDAVREEIKEEIFREAIYL